MLAKAVAHHTTAAFIRVVGSEFVQKYLGEVSGGGCSPAFGGWGWVKGCGGVGAAAWGGSVGTVGDGKAKNTGLLVAGVVAAAAMFGLRRLLESSVGPLYHVAGRNLVLVKLWTCHAMSPQLGMSMTKGLAP